MDIVLLAGAGIAALAIGNYLIPRKDGSDFATSLGASIGTAAGEAVGGAVVGASYGLVLAPWNVGASIGGPLGTETGKVVQQANAGISDWLYNTFGVCVNAQPPWGTPYLPAGCIK